jgi:hypothetical protein
MDERQDANEPKLGPAGAGDDLQRLIEELRHKGMSPGQIRAVSESWEAACHDPMRKGRGGPSLPENSPKGRIPLPDPPEVEPLDEPEAPPQGDADSGLVDLLERTAPWPVPDQDA